MEKLNKNNGTRRRGGEGVARCCRQQGWQLPAAAGLSCSRLSATSRYIRTTLRDAGRCIMHAISPGISDLLSLCLRHHGETRDISGDERFFSNWNSREGARPDARINEKKNSSASDSSSRPFVASCLASMFLPCVDRPDYYSLPQRIVSVFVHVYILLPCFSAWKNFSQHLSGVRISKIWSKDYITC